MNYEVAKILLKGIERAKFIGEIKDVSVQYGGRSYTEEDLKGIVEKAKRIFGSWITDLSKFDDLTDEMNDAVDIIANHMASGQVLKGARAQVSRLRNLIRKLRGEQTL
jgi:hypothetical protein